jgi:hypothetical protein
VPVAYPCNPSYLGSSDWEDCGSSKKFGRPHLDGKKLGVVAHACHPSAGRKHKIGGPWSRPVRTKSETPISKLTRAKRAGGMVQGVEHLTNKDKALNSNLCITHTQKISGCCQELGVRRTEQGTGLSKQ